MIPDFGFRAGDFPLILSIPHNGNRIPPELSARMTDAGRESRDTDWYLDRLYSLPELEGCSAIVAGLSRYVIDLNRPPDDECLYPGQNTTGLVPSYCFDGDPIWLDSAPDGQEVQRLVRDHWRPYHECLGAELLRLRERFGKVALLDAHSIRSRLPRLFPGKLPDFNLGTNRGSSCGPGLLASVMGVLRPQRQYSWVINGRFVGGYITRHYGRPDEGIHALQIELAQCNYMDEAAGAWDDGLAPRVQSLLSGILAAVRKWIQT